MTLPIPVWAIWAIVALVFVIIEIFTAGFAVICFSFGALAAAICSACHLGLLWQLVAFVLFTTLAFLFVRPAVLKMFAKSEKTIKTNTDAIIGRTARVTERIDPAANTGRAAVDGDDWKAVTEDGTTVETGTAVEITGRDGLILSVRVKKA